MAPSHFRTLSNELIRRLAGATLSHVSPGNHTLRAHLLERLSRPIGSDESLLSIPVFESLFDWETSQQRLDEVPFLRPALVNAMDMPPEALTPHRFAREWKPRVHQMKAWEVLCHDPIRSVVVRTGTASGKTECFMVPILNDLAGEAEAHPARQLTGVRALFLYPLNALIHSQRSRLKAWTHAFQGRIRFALYNGHLPESVPVAEQRAAPEEVLSRMALRADPPPVLVTNATMLEYMLVRHLDKPILDESRGKLRWIVLDEAHTYLGSQAAEIALLLRRVMDGFEVDANQVRFVATSATIGDEPAGDPGASLRAFLSRIAGIPPENVVVVDGRRVAPPLEDALLMRDDPLPDCTELAAAAPEACYRALASCGAVRALRETLVSRHMSLDEVVRALWPNNPVTDALRQDALSVLDLASTARGRGGALLPLRGHFFGRGLSGAWACCNPACTAPGDTRPTGEDWGFGAIYRCRKEKCSCGALCFELRLCHLCGEPYLVAEERDNGAADAWLPRDTDPDDEAEDEGLTDDDVDGDAQGQVSNERLLARPGATTPPWVRGPKSFRVDTGVQLDDVADAPGTATVVCIPPTAGDNPECVRCKEPHKKDYALARPLRIGARVALGVNIPTLLAFEEPGNVGGERRPAGGRRLLTFADSRQGSARFALLSELDAERSYLRSFVYHTLSNPGNPTEIATLTAQIAAFDAIAPLPPALRLARDAAQTNLEQLLVGPPMDWPDIEAALEADDVTEWTLRSMRRRFLPLAAGLTRRGVARLLLLREFAKRPQRKTTLETMGLVSVEYPFLDNATAPARWTDLGRTSAEWRDFLKIAMDQVVRGWWALCITNDESRWLGEHVRATWLVEPETAGPVAGDTRRWPQIRPHATVRGRFAGFVRRLIPETLDEEEGAETASTLLRKAWNHIRPHLDPGAAGFRLNLSTRGKIRFRRIDRAWVCPVTGRLLDATIANVSPYVTDSWQGAPTCREVTMPRLPLTFPAIHNGGARALHDWLETDDAVSRARSAGAWGEFSDRIASFVETTYFSVGEHSAQRTATELRVLEEQFSQHNINVLSCSTTMEMGVDIGGLNAVAMNNVPPGPANYRQRAGRAGRRDAARATVMTYCAASPHGEEVFQNPLWPFETVVQAPTVSLGSSRIVARHVYALALGRFFRHLDVQAVPSLDCKGFFAGPHESRDGSQASRFCTALRVGVPDWLPEQSFQRVLANTAWEGRNTEALLADAASAVERAADAYWTVREALQHQLAQVAAHAGANNPAVRACTYQLERHDGEFLLRYLGNEGVLPTHGFPNDVVPFIKLTAEEFRQQHAHPMSDETAGRRADYPSRHISIAIREYAPGASVVIGGMVYKSGGVSLAWKIPAKDADVREIQDLGWAWTCRACGAADMSRLMPAQCPECEAPDIHRESILRPAGFAVDFWSKPHSNLPYQPYSVPNRTWISASGASWTPLGGASVGRVRYSPEGRIVHRNKGVQGNGYAICLACGRAAEETAEPAIGFHNDNLPTELANHRPLRRTEAAGAGYCLANDQPFAIRRGLTLGGVGRTDVLELQLFDPATSVPIGDDVVCTTLAVALRRAAAEALGIDPREIGWSVVPAKSWNGAACRSIMLYDTADGGAGYVSSIVASIASLIASLSKRLQCPEDCDAACHGCLVTHDTQGSINKLNRHAALAVLTDTFVQSLALPPELQVFGGDSQLEVLPIREALESARHGNGVVSLRVYLGPDGGHDPAESALLGLLQRYMDSGATVGVVLSRATFRAMPKREIRDIYTQLFARGVRVSLVDGDVAVGASSLVAAEVQYGRDRHTRWAVRRDVLWGACANWGEQDGRTAVVRCDSTGLLPAIGGERELGKQDLDLLPDGATRTGQFVQTRSFQGARAQIDQVGVEFWEQLCSVSPELADALRRPGLTRVSLRDPYIASPLNTRIVYEVFRHLITIGAAGAETEFVLLTRQIDPGRRDNRFSGQFRGDYADDAAQAVVLETVLGRVCNNCTVHLKRHVEHDRILELEWAGQRLTIYLDHGLTFLDARAPGTRDYVSFNFGGDAKHVADRIRNARCSVKVRHSASGFHVGVPTGI